MFKSKKIYYIGFPMLLVICVLSSSITNAKYFFEAMGVAWQSHITDFKLLKDVFEATDEVIKSDNLWAPKDSTGEFICESLKVTPGDGASIATGEDYYFLEDEYVQDASGWFSSGKELTSTAKNLIKDYSLISLNNIEFNIMNSTDSDVVVTFDICYYAPKTTETDIGQLYYSVYNSYLYPNTDNTDGSKTNVNLLYGEIVTNPHDKITSDGTFWKEIKEGFLGLSTNYYTGKEEGGQADKYADALSCRIGNSDQNGFAYDGEDYHCHKAHINPYGIINANKSYFNNPTQLLNSFILEKGETQSFNLSIYYKTFGYSDPLDNYGGCFYSGVQLVARKLEYTVSFYNNAGTSLYNFSSVTNGAAFSNQTKLSEGSFFTNFGIPFPDLSYKADGEKITKDPNYPTDWVFYTTGEGDNLKVVDKGTTGAKERDFTYFTKVTGDMKVYAK